MKDPWAKNRDSFRSKSETAAPDSSWRNSSAVNRAHAIRRTRACNADFKALHTSESMSLKLDPRFQREAAAPNLPFSKETRREFDSPSSSFSAASIRGYSGVSGVSGVSGQSSAVVSRGDPRATEAEISIDFLQGILEGLNCSYSFRSLFYFLANVCGRISETKDCFDDRSGRGIALHRRTRGIITRKGIAAFFGGSPAGESYLPSRGYVSKEQVLTRD